MHDEPGGTVQADTYQGGFDARTRKGANTGLMVAGTVVAHSDAFRAEVFTRVGNAPVCVLTDAFMNSTSRQYAYTLFRREQSRTCALCRRSVYG